MNKDNSQLDEAQATPSAPENPSQNRPENMWLNLGLNIIVPSLILMKGSRWLGAISDVHLQPAFFLSLALLFPVSYGLFDFHKRKKYNFFSILGFISILITGGVGLFKLDKDWIAVKEAAVPALFGLAVMATLKTRKPLVRLFLYNDQIFDVHKIEAELNRRATGEKFNQLLVFSTLLLAFSFLLSAMLNYGLASFFIQSESGTEAFNREIGKMTFWSYPVIVVPSMAVLLFALYRLIKGINQLTGLDLEEILLQAKTSQGDEESENEENLIPDDDTKQAEPS